MMSSVVQQLKGPASRLFPKGEGCQRGRSGFVGTTRGDLQNSKFFLYR